MTIHKKISFNTSLLFVLITFSILTHETLAYFVWPDRGCDFLYSRGPCNKDLLRFWYNKTSNKCDFFIYGGCKGNENNFESKQECITACVPQNPLLINTLKELWG